MIPSVTVYTVDAPSPPTQARTGRPKKGPNIGTFLESHVRAQKHNRAISWVFPATLAFVCARKDTRLQRSTDKRLSPNVDYSRDTLCYGFLRLLFARNTMTATERSPFPAPLLPSVSTYKARRTASTVTCRTKQLRPSANLGPEKRVKRRSSYSRWTAELLCADGTRKQSQTASPTKFNSTRRMYGKHQFILEQDIRHTTITLVFNFSRRKMNQNQK